MNDQEQLKKYELHNIAQCDRISILEAQNKHKADRIAELEKAVIAENEACAQILLDSYDTTEPFQEISPDWLLVLVDEIDNRVGRIRE